jgi:steroid delta-isomerase-like uncharacterized protein
MPETAEQVARRYFGSIRAGHPEAQEEAYADDATITIHGTFADAGKRELIAYFEALWQAFPDFRFEVLDVVGDGAEVAAARWRITGTFAGPGGFQGFEPNGARVDFEGVDVVRVRDGRIVRNDAYADGMTVARQLGALPPDDSPIQRRMVGAFNLRTRLARRIAHGPEPVAHGVWVVQGEPGKCNVYLVRDGDGVLMFDAGARTMVNAVAAAAAQLGGLTRIVLGHGHTDHRGVAPSFDVPVLCHPDEVADAEGSGGWRYWDRSLHFLPAPLRPVHRVFHDRAWDGGPVTIAGTVAEGDDVAGFRVVHLPGHAPGLIALWRESDRLALTTDAFYTVDMWGRDRPPALPVAGYNLDTEQARASLRKLAALAPAAAWPGHAKPVTGDVRGRLERAAA